MAELLNSYDSYSDFSKDAFFVICYDAIPSNISFATPHEETKENLESVLNVMDFKTFDIQVVNKNWHTEDAKNSDFSKDFPYQLLFKSNEKKLLIWISLEVEELEVVFLYDSADKALEEWVISANHNLRSEFGESRAPVFKVLSRNGGNFYTEDVKTEYFELEVDKLYNDDFIKIDQIIQESLEKEKAGLILLHGTPGTGKTSYIKSLISKHDKKIFIFIQNEFVNELLHPDFISFLIKHKNSILIIEDAEKVITTREYSNENSVVATILQLTDGLFSDYLNIKIICTFNTSMEKIDKALLRKGRMIAYHEFKPLSSEKSKKLMKDFGVESDGKEMTLADIFNYSDTAFDKSGKGKKIGF